MKKLLIILGVLLLSFWGNGMLFAQRTSSENDVTINGIDVHPSFDRNTGIYSYTFKGYSSSVFDNYDASTVLIKYLMQFPIDICKEFGISHTDLYFGGGLKVYLKLEFKQRTPASVHAALSPQCGCFFDFVDPNTGNYRGLHVEKINSSTYRLRTKIFDVTSSRLGVPVHKWIPAEKENLIWNFEVKF